jgi:hypothetical protein
MNEAQPPKCRPLILVCVDQLGASEPLRKHVRAITVPIRWQKGGKSEKGVSTVCLTALRGGTIKLNWWDIRPIWGGSILSYGTHAIWA